MGISNVLLVLKISVLSKLVQNFVMVMDFAIMEFAYALQDMIQPRIVNFIPVILIA